MSKTDMLLILMELIFWPGEKMINKNTKKITSNSG